MRILVLSVELPFPPMGGGPTRTYQLLKALSLTHEITIIGFSYDDSPRVSDFPVNVVAVPWELPPLYSEMHSTDNARSACAYQTLARDTSHPWFVSYFSSESMRERLAEVCHETFDCILIEDTDMAQYLSSLPEGVPKILDFHNVYTLMAKRGGMNSSGLSAEDAAMEITRVREFEKAVAQECELCLACSSDEASAAETLLDLERVAVIPNGVDTNFFVPSRLPTADDEILFSGTMCYPPNVEAARWMSREVLPLVRAERPNATLHLVGMKPPPEVTELASNHIIVHGQVPDMRAHFASATVVAVPILSGGGTRLKVLEAAACGKAIVSTTLGAEGIDLEPGRDILIADSAAEFARAITKLLEQDRLRGSMGQSARRAVMRYDWQQIGKELLSIVEGLRPHRNCTIGTHP